MRYTTAAVAVMLMCCCREKQPVVPAQSNASQTNQVSPKDGELLPPLLTHALNGAEILAQKFTVSHTRPVTITARKGLKVTVNAASLCREDGLAVTEPVEVEIKELTNAMDMLLANAPTMSNGRMLESGGAYFVGMRSGGQALRLRAGKKIPVQVPKISQKNMELFYGQPGPDGQVNWKPAAARFTVAAAAARSTKIRTRFGSGIKKVWVRDSITTRPASLPECMHIYNDSVRKARYAYGIANRHRLSHRQEMHIYLQPIDFPYARFKQGVISGVYYGERDLRSANGCFNISLAEVSSFSRMYLLPDTVPLYKEVPVKQVQEGETVTVDDPQDLAYYEPAEIDQLGWINCDRFYGDDIPISKNIRIQLPDTSMVDAAKVYILFNNINSVLAENINYREPMQILPLLNRMPEGAPVTLILVGVRNNKLYTGRKKVVLKSDLTIDMPLQPMRSGSLAAEIGG